MCSLLTQAMVVGHEVAQGKHVHSHKRTHTHHSAAPELVIRGAVVQKPGAAR